ncbi:transcriptional regulator ATRX [Brachionus plicatilis]|uniref:Transcriptional regulator ATRX n=1 Tax=Brachionus plicatilis TaxID=10195 RepID=A0A3M7SG85_BRAPC|nr:transcriptional regulator ATRX [Brachionus plicatilis]
MFVRIVNGKGIKPQKLVQSFNRYLLSPGPNLVICDEGHMLKVATSALSKSVSRFDTARRIVLTGTPLQNNLMEYHCMLSFVKPNLLGTIKEFKNRFANPISNGQHKDSTEADVRYMKKRAHILHDVLDGCVQRKDYAVIRSLLRPKKEFVLSIRLSDIQVDLYRAYIQKYGIGTKISKTKGAELFQDFQNLYSICSHPWVLKLNEVRLLRKEEKLAEKNFVADLDEEEIVNETEMVIDDDVEETVNGANKLEVNGGGVNSEEAASKPVERWWTSLIPGDMEFDLNMGGKLVVLERILKLCAENGDKLLLFSQSLLSLDLIEIFLEKLSHDKKDRWRKDEDYYRLDGQTDVHKRQSDVDKFNDERNRRGRFFLISTRAGGIGINLVGANRCIIFDACWNPSYDTQSIFRIYRFGQKKDVFVYRFLAQGTMEEKIYQRQVTKQSLSHRVIDEHQIDRHFTSQEINELYKFEPDLWDGKSIVHDIPDDSLLKSLLVDCKKWIAKYHEHDSLLENKLNEGLSEEERKAAWEEYENEKNAQNVHSAHTEPFLHSSLHGSLHNSLHNLANDPQFMRMFPNELNRMSEPFNAHIQAIQREELTKQIEQQNEMMRQHELRNFIQKERLAGIQGNSQPNYLQRMTQMFQNNQFNSNIRIPSGQRNEKALSDLYNGRHMPAHQHLTSILQGTPKASVNENKPRDYVSPQQAKFLNSRNSISSMNKQQAQASQMPNSNQKQTRPMRPNLTEAKPMES